MLSIGKLAVGHADYYLEQAHGAVTRVGSVRSGVEDYYLGGPEAPGTWIGSGTRPLGLQGKVDADGLDRVLAGEHPVSGEPLGRVVRQRVPGFDLTFSAPKSVSVLFGAGLDEHEIAQLRSYDRSRTWRSTPRVAMSDGSSTTTSHLRATSARSSSSSVTIRPASSGVENL
jgi:hypothetical protein